MKVELIQSEQSESTRSLHGKELLNDRFFFIVQCKETNLKSLEAYKLIKLKHILLQSKFQEVKTVLM